MNPRLFTEPQAHIARILIRGVNWLGDAIMTTPALLRLREAYPQAHITLLSPSKLADLFHAHPAIDDTITFAPGDKVWQIGQRLRQSKYDLGLVFPNSPRSALELWWAGLPRRVGVSRGLRNCLLTTVIPALPESTPMLKRSRRQISNLLSHSQSSPTRTLPARAHHIHHYLHLAAAVGASSLPLPPLIQVNDEDLQHARARFGLEGSPLLGLNPGAEYGPAKRWPADRFAAVALEAQRQWNCRWVILGGAGDVAIAHEIAHTLARAGYPPIVLAGQTSLRELAAVLKLCRVVLTNDTGPMHLSAAVGTPVIALFGSTSPELTGPGLPGATQHACLRVPVPCSPCFRRDCPIDFRCMLEMEVDLVLRHLSRMITG